MPIFFAFLPQFGTMEMLIAAGVALLLFGNRLPGVMRSLGKSVVEFKKGISGVDDGADPAVAEAKPRPSNLD